MEGFRIEDFLKEYVEDVSAAFPEVAEILRAEYGTGESYDTQREIKYFEDVLRPHMILILQKSDELFTGEEPRLFLRGVDFRTLWAAEGVSESTKDALWKYIRLSLASCVLGGGSAESMMESVVSFIKSFLGNKTGKSAEELDSIFEDEETQGRLEELIEAFMQTKLAKIATELIETFDFTKLGLEELTSTNPADLLEIIKNPEHPIMKRAIRVIQQAVEEKMRVGAITKEEILAEVEGLKERFKLALGKYVEESILGETRRDEDKTDSRVLLSGHPDARRARMLARLQRKVGDRKK